MTKAVSTYFFILFSLLIKSFNNIEESAWKGTGRQRGRGTCGFEKQI